MIFPSCILPIKDLQCVSGETLENQVKSIDQLLCAQANETVTVNFGTTACTDYKYEVSIIDNAPTNPLGSFTLSIDLFAFTDSVPHTFNLILKNNTSLEILYNGALTSLQLPKPLLLQGVTAIIQFITNETQIKTYQETFVLTASTVMNQSFAKYMSCNTTGVITATVQTILQTIINKLQNCC